MIDEVDEMVIFDSESWVDDRSGPRKPMQGFTYNVPEKRDEKKQELKE